MTSKVEKTMESYTQMSQNIQALVEKVNAILISIGANGASNIDTMLEEIRQEALKVAKNPLDDATLQAQLESIQSALDNALAQLQANGGVDAEALKAEIETEIQTELEGLKSEIETKLEGLKSEIETSLQEGLREANTQIEALKEAKDEILLEVGSAKDAIKEAIKQELTTPTTPKRAYKRHMLRGAKSGLLDGTPHISGQTSFAFATYYENEDGSREYHQLYSFSKGNSTAGIGLGNAGVEKQEYIVDIPREIPDKIVDVIQGGTTWILVTERKDVLWILGNVAVAGIAPEQGTYFTQAPRRLVLPEKLKDAYICGNNGYYLLEDGRLFASGLNQYGEFGMGNTTNLNFNLTQTTHRNIAGIFKGDDCQKSFLMCWNKDGDLSTSGHGGQYLAMGDGMGNMVYATPAVKTFAAPIEKGWSNGLTSIVTLANGEVYACGYNAYANVGNGDRYSQNWVKINVPALKSVYFDHKALTMGLTKENELYVWGNGTYGYGNSAAANAHLVPTKIESNVKEILAGSGFYAYILKNGDLYVWGNNALAQSGKARTNFVTREATKIYENCEDIAYTDAIGLAADINNVICCNTLRWTGADCGLRNLL